MKINLAKINLINIMLYICLSLFVMPSRFRNILTAIFCLISFIVFIGRITKVRPKNMLLMYLITGIFVIYIIVSLLHNREISNLISSIIFIYISFIQFNDRKDFNNIDKENRIIYYLWIIWLVFFLSYQIKMHGLNNYKFYFPSIGDKNFTAVAIFLFLHYCIKNNFKVGIMLSLIYTIMLKSRLIYLSLIIYLVTAYYLRRKGNNENTIKKIEPYKVFLIFITCTIFTIGLSYFITYKIPRYKITSYRESIIDISNAIRFRSNIYAIEHIKSHKALIIRGYDNNLLKELGISNDINTTRYLGFAIVQPHNFIINMFLKLGIVSTLLYVYCISNIISKHWNKENIPIIISYIFINMFMHSLLSTNFLVFFLAILAFKKKERIIHEEQ